MDIAFLQNSTQIGVPTVLLEVAASGRAIVTTNHPGFSAMVKDGKNGLLIPKDNVPALAKAIARLLADPGRRQQTAGR